MIHVYKNRFDNNLTITTEYTVIITDRLCHHWQEVGNSPAAIAGDDCDEITFDTLPARLKQKVLDILSDELEGVTVW